MEISNGMWPWLSEVGLSEDGRHIFCYRNQGNHNGISPNLSNDITNNCLCNSINADMSGKVYAKDMGNNMICLLTFIEKVSVDTMLKHFYNFLKFF